MKPKKLLKNTLLVLMGCFLNAVLFAQNSPLPKQSDKRFGGTKEDVFISLQQTKEGGYILGGYSWSGIGGDKTQDTWGLDDYWVLKIDTTGIKQWDKRFGGTDLEQLNSIQQTKDGGYILGGWSNSGIGGDKTEGTRGGLDYWIVKTDSSGIKQWDKRFGGSGKEELYAVKQTKDGGYILGGESFSDIGGDKTESNRGICDYWIVKIDANGIKQWDKRFGGINDEYLIDLQETKDGGYILGGFSGSPAGGDKTQDNWGAFDVFDYWVVKIDANGIKQWDKRFGGTDYDELWALQQTKDGGYILGGYSWSGINGDKTEDTRGGKDYWIVKIDSNGIKQWDKRFGGSAEDDLKSLQQTSDRGYILGGWSSSGISGDKTQDSRGLFDYWIVKVDVDGINQWDKRFGGTSNDYLYSLQQTTDNGFVAGGYSRSGITGDKTQAGRGLWDYWVVKLGCPPAAQIITSGSRDLCQTGSVVLKVNSTDTLQYQWRRNNQFIAGATQRNYTATETGTYNVLVYTDTACRRLSNAITVIKSCKAAAGSSIMIYPNPSRGIVTVTYKSLISANVQLKIYDKTGRLMFIKPAGAIAGSNVYELNLSNLPQGVYNLELNNENEIKNVKFVIEK